ncbi:MAG TPA: pyridoxal phosphate-dependent aminotransferase [Verrucomicrobiae bacterium]
MRESSRIAAVQSPVIPVVADMIRQCPGTISLGQGVVHYGPPPQALASISTFLADPENHKYKPVDGVPALREKLAQKLRDENGIQTGQGSSLMVTAGGNMAFMNALLVIADPGDEIIIQTPYYFNHEMAIAMANCRPVLVPTDECYQLRIDAIRSAISPRTRAIVTISPNNPTGAVYPEQALREVNRLCAERGIYHIHDEAYENFVFGDAIHFSPGRMPGSAAHTISLFSFSKAYGFASWRIGYMVFPSELHVGIKKIQDTILICAPVISQYAAAGALEAGSEFIRGKIAGMAEVRALVSESLGELRGICSAPKADGAFYFLLRLDSEIPPLALVERLVREHRVAAIPGNAFGIHKGCTLRIAYGALQAETAAEAMRRLVSGLKEIVGT